MSLEQLLQRADLWRGGERSPHHPVIASGRPQLDRQLGGGWPRGALTELLSDYRAIGALELLLPALAAVGRDRWLAWIAPPHIPYAPALAAAGIDPARLLWIRPRTPEEGLWAAEQALRSGSCGAVLHWPQAPSAQRLRRLQLAAEQGDSLGFLFRPRRAAQHPSPAALRLELYPTAQGVELHLLKRRGGWAGPPFTLHDGHAVA